MNTNYRSFLRVCFSEIISCTVALAENDAKLFDADSQKLCRTADGQAADYFENNATDYNLYIIIMNEEEKHYS